MTTRTGRRHGPAARSIIFFSVALGALVGCGDNATRPPDDSGGGPQIHVVRAVPVGTRFQEARLSIQPGMMVRWVSESGIPHTVTPVGHSEFERAEAVQKGTFLEHVFDEEGTYEYRCDYHWEVGMVGTVIVER